MCTANVWHTVTAPTLDTMGKRHSRLCSFPILVGGCAEYGHLPCTRPVTCCKNSCPVLYIDRHKWLASVIPLSYQNCGLGRDNPRADLALDPFHTAKITLVIGRGNPSGKGTTWVLSIYNDA